MKPKAQPHPRQDSQQSKDRTGRPLPKGDRADSASPHDGFIGLYPDAGKANHQRQGENALYRSLRQSA